MTLEIVIRWRPQPRQLTFLKACGLNHPFTGEKPNRDVFNYQSQQFDIVLFDEATHFLRFQYRYMLTRNRATTDNSDFVPFMAMATNPGNVGHMWFRKEFINIGDFEEPHSVEVEPGKYEVHMFIPAKLSDNQKLEKRDPNYRESLEAQPEIIRKQLLDEHVQGLQVIVISD